MVDEPILSSSTLRALSIFCQVKKELPWLTSYCSVDGGLVQDIEQFLRSLGKLLRSELALYGWRQEYKKPEEEGASGGSLKLFPANWDLSGCESPVHFAFTWCNPFVSDPADRYLCAEVAAPREWPHWEKLKHLLRPKLVPRGFTDVYEADDVDPNSLFWIYVPFDQFMVETGLDTSEYLAEIKQAARLVCEVRPAIDEFLSKHQPAGGPQEAADLRVIAFLDTETTGLEDTSEIIELAILNAACDPVTGEILGILEEYVGQREPRMAGTELAARASGLTSSFLRGKSLDEHRVKDLLTRADCIVAHNASFDCRMLTRLYPWAGKLKNWKCSLHGVRWEAEVGMTETNLQGLMADIGVKTEGAHRARPDALGMLQLLSRRYAGKTLLARLLGW
jgi:hypothetical protein